MTPRSLRQSKDYELTNPKVTINFLIFSYNLCSKENAKEMQLYAVQNFLGLPQGNLAS